jgi:hypothetical protein
VPKSWNGFQKKNTVFNSSRKKATLGSVVQSVENIFGRRFQIKKPVEKQLLMDAPFILS